MSVRTLLACSALFVAGAALGQGQDGTPGERNLQIMAALLAGIYDNANQAYFDTRLKFPEERRHDRTSVRIDATENPDMGPAVFTVTRSAGGDEKIELWALAADADPLLVRMRRYAVDGQENTYRDGCDVLWRRDAGQFTGAGESERCTAGMQLSPEGLWLDDGRATPAELTRAREFSCHVDIPGVGGGRDEPFDRYPISDMHDQGALHWFDSKEGQRIGISLRNVRWPMNNEIGAFTRNSLVMSVIEKTEDGIKEHGYGWTEPRAERIGLNLKWLLVNCYRVSNRDVVPFFD
ncbi:MAG: hypothetical protein ACR2QV_16205 [Gammaproteobacteria bacterium]